MADNLSIKLALFHYFIDWNECPADPEKTDFAGGLVAEFEQLSSGNYSAVYQHLDKFAMRPQQWLLSKQVATCFVDSRIVHEDCNSAVARHLDENIFDFDLTDAAEDFLRSCHTDVLGYHYSLYRLAQLITTGKPVYGGCYYMLVVGNWAATNVKSSSRRVKALVRDYFNMDIRIDQLFNALLKEDNARLRAAEINAWNSLIDFSHTPRRDGSTDFLPFVFKHLDGEYDYKAALTRKKRNKLLCAALFGCETAVRYEMEYHLKHHTINL